MKVDLSVPAIRDLVEHFSVGMKKLRDQARSLRIKNNKLTNENLFMREVAIDLLVKELGCSRLEGEKILKQRMINMVAHYAASEQTVN